MRNLFIAVVLGLLNPDLISAQFADFRDVDTVVSANLSVFEDLFRQAHSGTVTIAMFGDSQETSDHGGGRDYVPAFNFELNRRYGNTPVSSTAFARSYASRWLLGGSAHGVDQILGNSEGSILPSQRIGRFDNSPAIGGLLAQLNLDAGSTTPSFDAPGLEFDGRRVRVKLTVRDSIGSGEVRWRANIQDGDGRNYFGGVNIASGTTSLGLGSGDGNYVTADLGVIEIPDGHNSLQLIARGADANGVEIAGIRFYNEDNPVGMAMESFSAGGYKASRLPDDHGNARGAFQNLVDHDIISFHFGANDSINRTPRQFRDDLIEVIEMFRDWSGDADKPVILFTDPDRVIDFADDRLHFDQYAAVAASIAMSEENVLAVNSRLLAHEIGWRVDANLFQFASDGVHYSTHGAQRLAELEVGALFSALTQPAVLLGDVNLDKTVDFFDIGPFIEILLSGEFHPEADMDGSGKVDFSDIALFIGLLSN